MQKTLLCNLIVDETQKPIFTPDAITALCKHNWPGNVRELDNIIQRAKILCSKNVISVADLIFDNDGDEAQPNTAEILAAKFKANAASEVLS